MRLSALLLTAATAAFIASPATAISDPVVGKWWNEKKTAHIEIVPCGDSVCGSIVWMQEPNLDDGSPKRDANNEDEELRERTILGLQIIGGFEKEEPGVWEDGTIYNPRDGKTYKSNMSINDKGRLEVEGCVLIFCQSQVWEPVED